MFNFISKLILGSSFLVVMSIFSSKENKTFHHYVDLPKDLQITTIKKMKSKSIFNLAQTSHDQRNLIASIQIILSRPLTIGKNNEIFFPIFSSNSRPSKRKYGETEFEEKFPNAKRTNVKFWQDLSMAGEEDHTSDLEENENNKILILQMIFENNDKKDL